MRRYAVSPITSRLGSRHRTRGQALVEFALVFPLFLMVLFSVISFGLYIFYNQQLANAAREAARYAAVHSSTAQCPTVSRLDPIPTSNPTARRYNRCDAPENGWPKMTGVAQSKVWGMAPATGLAVRLLVRLRGPFGQLRCPAGVTERVHRLHDQPRQSEDRSDEPRLPQPPTIGSANVASEGRRGRQGERYRGAPRAPSNTRRP